MLKLNNTLKIILFYDENRRIIFITTYFITIQFEFRVVVYLIDGDDESG